MGRYGKLVTGNNKPENDTEVAETTTPSPVKKPSGAPTRTIAPTIAPSHQSDIVAVIHKAMRQPPAAGTNYRLSTMEKKRLDVIVFQLKTRDIASPDDADLKTNINEVLRIAVNSLLIDYDNNGDNSVLVETLKSLRS